MKRCYCDGCRAMALVRKWNRATAERDRDVKIGVT
jgi:hypothetical protein